MTRKSRTQETRFTLWREAMAYSLTVNPALAVQVGSFLCVPAGQIHRFEDFTSDFAVWVAFYGPEGGELGIN